jgi:Leucine-rich repeat (LRR) protein
LAPYTFANQNKAYSLSVSYNRLTQLNESDVFVGLDNLQSLYLNENQIDYIANDVFNGLSKLVTLSLANNSLSLLDFD